VNQLWLKPLALLLATAGVCLLSVIQGLTDPPQPANQGDMQAALLRQGQDNNAFALQLHQQLRSQSGNLFCSPFSIRTALGMVYAGAAGQTAQEMTQVLHAQAPDFHFALGALSRRLQPEGAKPAYQLNVANAIWVQVGLPLRDEFTALLKRDYGSGVQSVDFASALEAARGTINRWVEVQTKGRIRNLIPQGALNPETKLVLTNAIYFKGTWVEKFDKHNTKDEPFFVAADRQVKVPLMRQTETYPYHETEQWHLVRLPYQKCPLEMVILLPKQKNGLEAVEKLLTADALAGWIKQSSDAEVSLFLPRFTMTSQFELNSTLGQMGMAEAFSDRADFSGITSVQKLKIDRVIHKAFVEVNEEGTEAAAATGVTMMPTAAPARRKQVTVRADHPFVVAIRDRISESILFLGRCADPSR
jgi:serpin B